LFFVVVFFQLKLASRPPYAASATGVAKVHQRENTEIMSKTFQTTLFQ